MLKRMLLLGMIVPLWANAEIPFTKQDLIGKWECKVLIDDDFRSESVVEYRNDNIITDNTVLYSLSENDDLYQIEKIQTLSKWKLDSDKISYYDGIVQSYKIDMPNYDRITAFANYDKELMLVIKEAMERPEIEQLVAKGAIGRIRFLDKNTYITDFEGIDEDFPADIENNHCKRKI